jgi:hypothetical protein
MSRKEELNRIILVTNSDIKVLLNEGKELWGDYYTGFDNLTSFERKNCEDNNKNYLVVLHDIKDESIVLFVCVGNESDVNYSSLIDSIKTIRTLCLDMIEACESTVSINLKNLCSKEGVNLDEDDVKELFRIYFTKVYNKFEFVESEELKIG